MDLSVRDIEWLLKDTVPNEQAKPEEAQRACEKLYACMPGETSHQNQELAEIIEWLEQQPPEVLAMVKKVALFLRRDFWTIVHWEKQAVARRAMLLYDKHLEACQTVTHAMQGCVHAMSTDGQTASDQMFEHQIRKLLLQRQEMLNEALKGKIREGILAEEA